MGSQCQCVLTTWLVTLFVFNFIQAEELNYKTGFYDPHKKYSYCHQLARRLFHTFLCFVSHTNIKL